MRIGLIGCGLWGTKILHSLLNTGVEVVVCDTNPEVGKILPGSIRIFHSFDQFLSVPVDAFIVASPASTHLKILKTIIPTELPIFVEKPVVVSLTEAESLKKLSGTNVYVMHIWKYHPGIQLLAELIKTKKIGEFKSARSRRTNWTSPRQDIDSVWNLVPHDLTIAQCLFGYLPAPEFAVAEIYNGIPRGMTAILGTEPFYHLEVSNRHWEKSREVRIHGSEGIAVLRNENIAHVDLYLGNDCSLQETVQNEKIYFDLDITPLEREITTFMQFVKGGAPPLTNLNEAISLIEVIDELRKLAGIPV